MKYFILLTCFSICFNSYAQFVPSEDYIECSKVSCYSPGANPNFIVKGGAFVYFNNQSVLIRIDGISKKTFFFHIASKKIDDGFLFINCFDSTKTAMQISMKDSIPDLSIKIGYKGTEKEYNSFLNSPLYLSVTCFFYTKNFAVDFGYPVYLRPKKMQLARNLLPPGSH